MLITMMAPIAPHISEEMYHNLIKEVNPQSKESVHMLDWNYSEELIDEKLESQMDVVRHIIEAGARGRDVARYKLRWPVSEIIVVSEDENVLKAAQSLQKVIMEQANTKKVLTNQEFPELKINVLPNMKTLGPKLRQDVPLVAAELRKQDGKTIKKEMETKNILKIELEDKVIELNPEDVVYETELPEDVVSAEFEGGSVFINTQITPEILSESMARELIRRIQDMRKDMDLDVESNIEVEVSCSTSLQNLVQPHHDFMAHEVRAQKIIFGENKGEYTKEWKIEDENLSVSIKKA